MTIPPRQSLLEEIYYHRIKPERGFGLMRVYDYETTLDEALTFRDRDCVLVPRGYHTVSAPPGYEVVLPECDGRPAASVGHRQRPRP